MGELSHLADMLGQPGLIARRRLLMDQTVTGSFVDQGSRSFQMSRGFVTAGGGPDIFDRLTQFGSIRPVAKPFGFGRLHALGAGFMIRQLEPFLNSNNKSASKYKRHISFVNH